MARARNIKPGFFTNEDLVELDFATRLLFAGLWTVADKAGRLEDRPKKIKIDVFPADDVDIEAMLSALAGRGFIQRYRAGDKAYIQVLAWEKHQKPHHTEKESVIPPPNGELTVKAPLEPVSPPEQDRGNRPDSLIPDSGFTDSSVANATGGNAASLTKAELWKAGKSLLAEQGMPKDQCGTFVGKLVKDYGDAVVVEAVRAAVVQRTPDAASYLVACCQRAKGTRAPPEPAWRKEQRQRTQIAAPGVAQSDPNTFFDVEAIDVTTRALG